MFVSNCSSWTEYRIVIEDDIITFAERPNYPRVVARANNTAISTETEIGLESGNLTQALSTLGGIASLANALRALDYGLVPPAQNQTKFTIALFPNAFALSLDATPGVFTEQSTLCAPIWRDPHDEAIAALNEISRSKQAKSIP